MNSNPIYHVFLDNHQDDFLKGFTSLLENQRFVDVNIICENKSIKVHKIVLVANSKYFQEILCEEYLELTLIFKSDHSVIMPIVEFIYYGKTSFTEKYIKEVVSAAKFLGIKGLSNIEFENSDELPIFYPPVITEIKRKFAKTPCFIHPAAAPRKIQDGIVLQIPFKVAEKNVEIFDDYSSDEYTIKPKKGRRGKQAKQRNPNFTLSVVTEMDRENEKSQYLLEYSKMVLENKIENEYIETSIIYSPNGHYVEDLIEEFPSQNGKWPHNGFVNESYTNEVNPQNANGEYSVNTEEIIHYENILEGSSENQNSILPDFSVFSKNQNYIYHDKENVIEYELIDQSAENVIEYELIDQSDENIFVMD